MLYSVRMRAAQGGPHEAGGRHISGAERIAGAGDLAALATEMLTRALAHSRGRADFINITVEAINAENVRRVPLLPVTTVAVPDVAAGREAAVAQLIKAGVAPRRPGRAWRPCWAWPTVCAAPCWFVRSLAAVWTIRRCAASACRAWTPPTRPD